MSEVVTNTPRLMAAAKEFNIGKDTLIEFLESKGFNTEDLKPTAKLTEQMYRVLQTEFQQDKAAKQKAEQIDLPKGAGSNEPKRKRDEEDLSFKKREGVAAAAAPAHHPPVVEKAVEEKPAEAKTEIFPTVERTSDDKTLKDSPKQETTADHKPPTAPSDNHLDKPAVEITKIEAPELEGPKVVSRIDLDAIDSSTRPKKAAKKKEEPVAEPQAPEYSLQEKLLMEIRDSLKK